MDISDIVTRDLFAFGGVEAGKSHHFHHINFLLTFPLEILIGQIMGVYRGHFVGLFPLFLLANSVPVEDFDLVVFVLR